ncbi:MAG: type II toxin-antitoxin system HicA family toxin [Gammaproteobacteria bacterium]
MKLPRDVSGAALIKILEKHFGYRQVHQVGSHVVLETNDPHHHRMAVPAHGSLRLGTLNAVLRAVAKVKHIDNNDILSKL